MVEEEMNCIDNNIPILLDLPFEEKRKKAQMKGADSIDFWWIPKRGQCQYWLLDTVSFLIPSFLLSSNTSSLQPPALMPCNNPVDSVRIPRSLTECLDPGPARFKLGRYPLKAKI